MAGQEIIFAMNKRIKELEKNGKLEIRYQTTFKDMTMEGSLVTGIVLEQFKDGGSETFYF